MEVFHMLNSIAALLFALPRALPAEELPLGVVITELVLAVLLLVAMLLVPKRFLKLICACGSVICLFLACKMAFGPQSIITQIMCWITAAAVCILTVSIVNHINWSELRGRPGK